MMGVLEEGFRVGSDLVCFGHRGSVFYMELLRRLPTGSKGLTVPLDTVPPRLWWGARGGVLNGAHQRTVLDILLT